MEKKTIGALIAALRKANGMTQRELAEKLHVSDKSISRWEDVYKRQVRVRWF